MWECRGSAIFASVSGNNRVEPIVANGNINTANGVSPDRAQCADSETGAGNTPTQLGISTDFLGAVTGKASTAINPDLGQAIDQKIAAEGRVEDLTLLLGASGPTIGVGAANATAAAGCVPGNTAPQFSGDSRVADLTLGGRRFRSTNWSTSSRRSSTRCSAHWSRSRSTSASRPRTS